MPERKMLDQKILSRLISLETIFKAGLKDVEDIRGMLEVSQSKRVIDSNARQAFVRLNHLRKCEKRLLKNKSSK